MKFAVLFDLALQMQRNGLVALLRDILTCQKALIDARNIIFVPLSDSANLCVDDTKESGKAFWTLVNFNSSPAVTSLSIRVNGMLWAV